MSWPQGMSDNMRALSRSLQLAVLIPQTLVRTQARVSVKQANIV